MRLDDKQCWSEVKSPEEDYRHHWGVISINERKQTSLKEPKIGCFVTHRRVSFVSEYTIIHIKPIEFINDSLPC